MTKKLIKNYTQNLKNIRDAKQGKVPNQTMTKINNIIGLYEDRKISQFTTAVNLETGTPWRRVFSRNPVFFFEFWYMDLLVRRVPRMSLRQFGLSL